MENTFSRKWFASIFAIILLIVATVLNSYAGERGCLELPGKNVGTCNLNTEGTYSCFLGQIGKDCISSN